MRTLLMRSAPAGQVEAMMLPPVMHGFSPLVRAAAFFSNFCPGFLISRALADAPPPVSAAAGTDGCGGHTPQSFFSSATAARR